MAETDYIVNGYIIVCLLCFTYICIQAVKVLVHDYVAVAMH
jgi:hypothetical protein